MTILKINPITGHDLTLIPPTPTEPNSFGWIRLLNGSVDAGYIYLVSPAVVPRLSFDGSYIVTSMPMSELQTILSILKSEANLQIRYFDPQAAGVGPSVFIEAASGQAAAADDQMNVPQEMVKEILKLRSL